MKIGMDISQKQSLAVTQQLVQNLEVLQMNKQELQSYLEKEAMENPAIDLERLNDGNTGERLRWLCGKERPRPESGAGADEGEDRSCENYGESASRGESLEENIRAQLSGCRLSEMERLIANYLIGCIDSRGYLDEEPEETAELLNTDSRDVEKILELLRSFSPAGVCARDLKHCLLAQLPESADNQLARRVVEAYMGDIAQSRYAHVAKALDTDVKSLKAAVKKIQALSPIPASGFETDEMTFYIEPDIQIMPAAGEELEIRLLSSFVPNLCLSPTYLSFLESTDDAEVKSYLERKFKSARWLINCVEQREGTLRRCAAEIAQLQKDYFLGRQSLPQPMTQSDVAERMGVHLSTVSRAVKGKYVQSVHGLRPMKELFTAKVGGAICSADEIKEKLRNIISAENPAKPFSDQQIVDKLKEAGVSISRRTAAKYREELGIPGMFARKNAAL